MTFWKFSKDSKLLDANYVKADVDIFWTMHAKGRHKVPFETFLDLLDEIAKRKNVCRAELDYYVIKNAKPEITGTRGKSKFYDDKELWSGVAAKGGPSTNDHAVTLATMTDTGK